MRQNSILRFVGFTAVVFASLAASVPAFSAAENKDMQDRYDSSVKCGAYMSYLQVLALEKKRQELKTAFGAAMFRNMREAVNLGKELGKSGKDVMAELQKALDVHVDVNAMELSNVKEIKAVATTCAPEIIPLLK